MDSATEDLAKQLNRLLLRAESAGKVSPEKTEIPAVVSSPLVKYDTLLGTAGYCVVCGQKSGIFVPDHWKHDKQGRLRFRRSLSLECPRCHCTFRFSFSDVEE